jgi:hypothetical protein
MPKWGWWVAAAFAFYYFFLRRSITGGALATGTIGIGTGANATPYPGYPPGYAPQGSQASGAPQPIIYQQAPAQNDTAQLLGGVGGLLTGVGNLAGGVLGALGSAGVFSSGTSSSSSASNWGGGYGGGGMTYAADPVSSSDFDFELF